MMDVELQFLHADGNGEDQVTPGNGPCSNHSTARDNENSCLLQTVQVDGHGRNSCDENNPTNVVPEKQPSPFCRNLARLNEERVCKLKLWMVILAVVTFTAVVVVVSLLLCTVHPEDEDETYDRSAFVVPRFFSGNFTVSSLLAAPSPAPGIDKRFLQLRQKVMDIYNSSFALQRYFSHAEIKALSPTSGTVGYKLQFVMPEEHGQLTRYTLSREVVYSVLLQQLQDQDTNDPLYIEPSSLNMQVGKLN